MEATELSSLSYVHWALHESGYQTDLIEADAHREHPYEELLVMYGSEKSERPLVVRLLFAEDVVEGLLQQQGEPQPPPAYASQLAFLCNLRRAAQVRVSPELRLLLNHLNQLLPLGKFLYTQSDGLILRYQLMLQRDKLNPVVVAETVETLGFSVGRFFPEIHRFLAGEKSLAEIRSQYPIPQGA